MSWINRLLKLDAARTTLSVAPQVTSVNLPTREIVTFPINFVTANLGTFWIYFPYKVTVNKIRAIVTTALGATSDATITCGNSTGASTGGVVTLTASSAVAAAFTATPTTNNVVLADGYYYLTSAKGATATGFCLVTLEVTRTA